MKIHYQPIRLIVGLGNPGDEYALTRHNAGAWCVESLAHFYRAAPFRFESKFQAQISSMEIEGTTCRLAIPATFMNHSGRAIKAITHFYNISPAAILVIHDDLDLPPGVARLKFDGGHGGHNGLRDTIKALDTTAFLRLRIGIGHPGQRDQVHDYVLHPPSKHDKERIKTSLDQSLNTLSHLVKGEIEKAMQKLHQ